MSEIYKYQWLKVKLLRRRINLQTAHTQKKKKKKCLPKTRNALATVHRVVVCQAVCLLPATSRVVRTHVPPDKFRDKHPFSPSVRSTWHCVPSCRHNVRHDKTEITNDEICEMRCACVRMHTLHQLAHQYFPFCVRRCYIMPIFHFAVYTIY